MKRKHRIAATAVATAALITGAAAALATVPSPPPSTTPTRLPAVVDSAGAQRAELVRLQAELAASGGRSAKLRVQIALLQKDIERGRTSATASPTPASDSVAVSATAVQAGTTRSSAPPRLAPASPSASPSAPPSQASTDDDGPSGLDG